MVYDCTNEESFKWCQTFFEEYEKHEKWSYTLFALVATKLDNAQETKVQHQSARDYAISKGWLYFGTSAIKNTQDEIQDKFSRLATVVLRKWWKSDENSLWDKYTETPEIFYRYLSQ